MKFGFIAKHRSTWPVAWLCEALGVSRSGFHARLHRGPSAWTVADEEVTTKVRTSCIASARAYGARRVWWDVLADSASCGLQRIERLMRANGLHRPWRRMRSTGSSRPISRTAIGSPTSRLSGRRRAGCTPLR